MSSDELDDLHHEILELLEDGRATPGYLASRTGESGQLINNKLRDLRLTGDVERVHKGLYELTHETGEAVAPHEVREADADLVELVERVEWEDISKTDDRVQACALLLTRIRRGARYTSAEIKDSADELGVGVGGESWRKAVNAAVDASDGVNRNQTAVYWSPR
ncbi:hypothetical protein Hbl1158_17100 (plasmid) [Halobaculum sp. CBA1158]|uniref:hypothetical protein n=1 Tax=Halobaculum sp. CBA1158 TaxID=2904243 RepID=UPI001F165721|nr:hypothetical protein [Halobaculum sp. CBA1158]UIP01720.1 hypothetical protein Hbl1158_17100 [Halobaculum sp. CBA1158]